VNIIRKILYPLSILYGEIVSIRNKAFDKGILTSTTFNLATIVVGNLNVGGTGKSPQIEYLVRLLENKFKIAILSRGYKRKSKGFQLANNNSTAKQIGDEPLQFYRKFNDIEVAVDADRINGIKKLKKINPKIDVILLDDAFQHRKVKGGYNILLTAYDNLYVNDTMLPTGDLREKVHGAKRANIIIVSKCPKDLTGQEQFEITQKLNPEKKQSVFFSSIAYSNMVINTFDKISITELGEYKVLLVTGIANANPLIKHLENEDIQFEHLKYSDHHDFSLKDKKRIFEKFELMLSDKKIILTTEKDFVRAFTNKNRNVYYIPIQSVFLDKEKEFNELILNYVQQNKRNV
jgi:tetraacyldisaccharide 4'-kinase